MTGLQLIFVIAASFFVLTWIRDFLPPPWGIASTRLQALAVAIAVPVCVVSFIGINGWW